MAIRLSLRSLERVEDQVEPSETAEIRVADLVLRTLSELGVNTFYGIPGGAIASIYDALVDYPEVHVINARHETGATFMAIGHSRAGGSLPCVLLTSGPGITNAITGLAAAFADGIPLVVIGGEVPRKNFGRGALQEGSRYQLDVLSMVRSVTKYSAEISNPRAANSLVRKAVATALSGRQGPVFLSLPLDVANERVAPMSSSSHVSTHFELDQTTMDRAAQALQNSERGLIIAGFGARHPETIRWIGTIASTLQIPVVTTPKAKGIFPENDPLALGVFGLGGHPSAAEYLDAGIDTLLCVGCGLGETGTNSWSPVLQASRAFIQVDIDSAQIGKNYHVDFGLVGPAHLILSGLASRIHRRVSSSTSGSRFGVKYYPIDLRPNEAGALQPARVIEKLQDFTPPETIFCSDIGEHTMFAVHYLRVNRPDKFIVSTGLGSMGSGLGAAIGAKVAHPSCPVVAICGDFGFQMFGMELATCVQGGIGVVFVVFNDARMRMVENGQTNVFGRTSGMGSHRIDFTAIARALGGRGFSIQSLRDFHSLPVDVFSSKIPTVLDVAIDPKASFPVNGRVAQIRNFTAS